MAMFTARIDMSDWDDLLQYVASVAREWPEWKCEAFRREMLAALEDGLDMFPEKDVFVVQPNGRIFSILNKYSLNPVA